MALLTFPPTFIAYGPWLDPGWVYAINRASADGLQYGRDFAFTYGPLGFVTCPMDVGQNLLIATGFRVAVFAAWVAAVALLIWARPVWRVVLFVAGAALAAAPVHSDAYNLDRTGALLTAVVYLLVAATSTGKRWPAVVAAALTGVAVLVKTNVGAACAGAVLGYGLSEVVGRGRPGLVRAAALLGVCGLTAGLVGLPYFDSVGAAVDYVRTSLLFAEGYTSHMTVPDVSGSGWWSAPRVAVAVAVVVAAAVACAAWNQPDLRADALILAFPLFTLYKGAVVRCDVLHWRPALFHALALLSVFVLRGRSLSARAVGLAVAAVSVGVLADAYRHQLLADRLGWGLRAVGQLAAWSASRAGLADAERTLGADALADFAYQPPGLGPQFVPKPAPLPWLQELDRSARTDIYPWELLLARDGRLNWTPRFVPQSYATFHPRLDDASAETYRRPSAPDFVVYHHQAIDKYHPFTVDPLTLTELVRWYEPDRQLLPKYFTLLRRRLAAGLDAPQAVSEGVARPGEVLAVPVVGPGEVVFLSLKYKMSAYGRAANFAYRVVPPTARFRYADGTTVDLAVGWRNAASGFLASPLPPDLDAMEAFLAGGDGARVADVTLYPNRAFDPAISYEWRKAARR